MLHKIKDVALSKTLKVAMNRMMKSYGEVLSFQIDSKTKSLKIEVMLEGEYDALDVDIAHYHLIKKEEGYFVSLKGIHTSRPWINTLATDYLEGKLFEIPSEYAGFVKSVL